MSESFHNDEEDHVFLPRVVVAPGEFAHRSPYNILSAKWQYCGPCKADNNPITTAIFIKELNFLRAIRIQWVKCSWTRFWIRRSYLRSSSLAVFFLWRASVFSPANIRNAASCDSSQSRLKSVYIPKFTEKGVCRTSNGWRTMRTNSAPRAETSA